MLSLHTEIEEGCNYHIVGKFRQVNLSTGVENKSDLFLRFQMGLTGEFLRFRLQQLDGRLMHVKKGKAETAEYVFEGECVADQEMADFKEVTSRARLSICQLKVEDGQFKVKIRSRSNSVRP